VFDRFGQIVSVFDCAIVRVSILVFHQINKNAGNRYHGHRGDKGEWLKDQPGPREAALDVHSQMAPL